MRSAPVNPSLFSRNRSRLGKLLPEKAMVLVSANPAVVRSGDQFYPYRQHSDFFYLTGIQKEGSVMLLTRAAEVLFIRKPDLKTGLWSGPALTREEASRLSGIGEVRWIDELEGFLDEAVPKAKVLFLNHFYGDGSSDGCTGPGSGLNEKLERLCPEPERTSLAPLMVQLRMIKEPEEVEQIRQACTMTGSAFLRVLGNLEPGMHEYEVEAQLTAEFIAGGARGHAFEPIVASGANALILHYVENNATCREGELLLIDFGAEVNNYAADCSRTIPVGGRFSERQREVYDAVYRIFLQARSLMVPGQLLDDFHNQVGKLWEGEHIALGLYSAEDAAARPGSDPLWKQYCLHGTSHSLGLDVHDPFDRTVPFRAGMVLACEPAIYIPGEGIGIRLENDILITGDGPVDLMEDIPIEPGELEALMNRTLRHDDQENQV
jgi:Xaa-Pro aminopeptidase